MKIKDLIIDPFKENVSKESITDIKNKIKDLSIAIEQILNQIANGSQSEFSTSMLVALSFDLQIFRFKEMFHSEGKEDKSLIFHKFAYSGSYSNELDDLLDKSFQQLSNINNDSEKLNTTFSKVIKDYNSYLKEPIEMLGFKVELL